MSNEKTSYVLVRVYQPVASKIGYEKTGALEFPVKVKDEGITIKEVLSYDEKYGQNLLSFFEKNDLNKITTVAVNGKITHEKLSKIVSSGDTVLFLPLYGGG